MKLSNPKSFDTNEVLTILRKAKLGELESFINTLASFISEVTSAMRNKLTVVENMSAIEVEYTLKHDTDTIIGVNGLDGKVISIIPLKVMPYANPITSFAWEYTITGELRCRAKFEGAPSTACTVRLRIES
jgi:hypothetical protein